MRRYIYRFIKGAGALTLSASTAFAQTPPPQQQPQGDGPRRGMRRVGRLRREGKPRGPRAGRLGLGRLNLSDAQREQLRGIESRYAAGFRAKREELRAIRQSRRQGGALTAEQESRARRLREELRADAERMRTEMRGLLTDEQRTQLQSLREEMKQRRTLLRERREELREQRRLRRQQQQPPAPPGTTDQL